MTAQVELRYTKKSLIESIVYYENDLCRSIKDVVLALVNRCPPNREFFPMVVRRSNVLVDALRRMQRLSFAPEKTLQV